ncbi:hypothetical protein SPHINGO391_120015 [Sphingomonas aurantiaca]|jgi:hypothetical protein|uniref:Uncharacterized protein n=1 Tax=Sphingomonas aurantiaca TaxID=185949 RepID=A0A5E7XS09_9SPHN|nr:hypothetical protein SPHINGO391_120015 [Sphingomonas aurantiaca]
MSVPRISRKTAPSPARFAAVQATLEKRFAKSAQVTELIHSGSWTSPSSQNNARVFTRSDDVSIKRSFLYTPRIMCKLFGRMLIDTPAPC